MSDLHIDMPGVFVINAVKAIITVAVLMIGGYAFGILFNYGIIVFTISLVYAAISSVIYLYLTDIKSPKEFFIKDGIYDNFLNGFLGLASSTTMMILLAMIADTIYIILTEFGNPVVQAAVKYAILTILTVSLFVFLKRNEVWVGGKFDFHNFAKFAVFGIELSTGAYATGCILVITSGILGITMTAIAFVLEIAFTGTYSYLDIREQIIAYRRREETSKVQNTAVVQP